MSIPVSCSCGKSFAAREDLAGKRVKCPNCQSPLTIPGTTGAGKAPAAASAPAPTAAPAEIIMGCGCGQQFRVEARFAGQQVQCPACHAVCVIPGGQSSMAPSMAPSPVQQTPGFGGPFDYQQAAYQQPVYQQPTYQPPGYSGSYGRPRYKTGLGIFIFAIAACVFGGGFGLQRMAEGLMEVRAISARASRGNRGMDFSASSINTMKTLNNITSILVKVGAIAMMLGMVAIIVAAVFCILSPAPLMALGITEVSLAALATILLLIFEWIPVLQNDPFGSSLTFNLMGLNWFSSDVGDALLGLLVRFSEIATFLIFSIFMMFALRGQRGRGISPDQPKFALIALVVCAGIHLLLMILGMIRIQGDAMVYVYMIIRWLAHAGMIVGLVLIIKSSFEAKRAYPL